MACDLIVQSSSISAALEMVINSSPFYYCAKTTEHFVKLNHLLSEINEGDFDFEMVDSTLFILPLTKKLCTDVDLAIQTASVAFQKPYTSFCT